MGPSAAPAQSPPWTCLFWFAYVCERFNRSPYAQAITTSDPALSIQTHIFTPTDQPNPRTHRCFCPPLSWMPRSPTSVSYPVGKDVIKSWALARRATRSTSSCEGRALYPCVWFVWFVVQRREVSGRLIDSSAHPFFQPNTVPTIATTHLPSPRAAATPYVMLSRIEQPKRTGSCARALREGVHTITKKTKPMRCVYTCIAQTHTERKREIHRPIHPNPHPPG